jgi:hypothetical protein
LNYQPASYSLDAAIKLITGEISPWSLSIVALLKDRHLTKKLLATVNERVCG